MNCKNFKTRTKTINKKRTIYNYCIKLKNNITYNNCKNCIFKEYKEYKKLQSNKAMKSRSTKLAKLEKNRFSVFTDNLDKCFLCPNKKDHLHEIFAGRNRRNSMKCGFVLPLCFSCHEKYQNDVIFNRRWYRKCQRYFEKNVGTRDEFIKIFGKSWL